MAWELAEKGNVGAFKEFGKLIERNDRMEVERELGSTPKQNAKPVVQERGGKKVLDARRALQLKLLTRRNDPAPAQTWGQDVATVLAAPHDDATARRLQNALKGLLRK